MISPEQIRAGRALINAKQSELASAAGISLATLNNIERGLGDPRASTLRAIEEALASAGVSVENDSSSETIILKKHERPSAYDSFSASQRVLDILGNDSLVKVDSLVFYLRHATRDVTDQYRVCLLINGKVRKVLFDQVGFTLTNSARIAEVAGIMLAALVTFPKESYFCKSVLDDTTLSPVEDVISRINSLENSTLLKPQEFFELAGDWSELFAPCLEVAGHPLSGLLNYAETHQS